MSRGSRSFRFALGTVLQVEQQRLRLAELEQMRASQALQHAQRDLLAIEQRQEQELSAALELDTRLRYRIQHHQHMANLETEHAEQAEVVDQARDELERVKQLRAAQEQRVEGLLQMRGQQFTEFRQQQDRANQEEVLEAILRQPEYSREKRR